MHTIDGQMFQFISLSLLLVLQSLKKQVYTNRLANVELS